MGWLRNHLIFPDDVWEQAADKLGGEFVKGRWLANSEINLVYHNHPIKLKVTFGEGDDGDQYTRAVPGTALNPKVKLAMMPKPKGMLGKALNGLATMTGATIQVPALGEGYIVVGVDDELANAVFGHPDFVSAMKTLDPNPSVCVGRSNSIDFSADHAEQDEDHFNVSLRGVAKDKDQLVALVVLTTVLLDVLEENGCLGGE